MKICCDFQDQELEKPSEGENEPKPSETEGEEKPTENNLEKTEETEQESPVVGAESSDPVPQQSAEEQEKPGKDASNKEEIDINLNDPEVEKAAEKIQAGFRGMMTRRSMKVCLK